MQTTLKQAPRAPAMRVRRSLARPLAFGAAALALLLVVGYLAFGYLSASQLTVPGRVVEGVAPRVPPVPYEDVRFSSRVDGISIAGTYMPSAGAMRAVIVIHGQNNNRKQEFDGRFVDMAMDIQKAGFALLMIDLRGHGESGEGRITFGQLERRDVLGAVDYLKSRGFQPGRIGVLGVSLGGASATGAAAVEPAIGALATDSMFADFVWVLQTRWQPNTGYPDFLMYGTLFMSRFVTGANLMDASPKNEIGKVQPRPILIMQGTEDDAVLSHHWAALRAAAPSAEFWEVAGAKHARIYNVAREEYVRRVVATFTKMPK